jgi:hypothetical protein
MDILQLILFAISFIAPIIEALLVTTHMLPSLFKKRHQSGWNQPEECTAGYLQYHPNNTPVTKKNVLKGLLEKIKSRNGGYTGVANRASSVAPASASLSITGQEFPRPTRKFLQRKENGPQEIGEPRESRNHSIDPVFVPPRRNTTGSLPNRTPTTTRNIKDPLERIKSRKRGYTGVTQRANTFHVPEHVDLLHDHGTCFQCDRQLPKRELQDQSRVHGHVVGICNDCYPKFLQYLEDVADAGYEDFDIEGNAFVTLKIYEMYTD